MKTLFKNGNLISFDNEKARNVDILVNNGIIEKIGNLSAEKVDKIVDLKDNIITPAFANCFYRSLNAVKNSYFDENRTFSSQEREIIKKYMKEKNILSGALYFYDFSFETPFSLIDNLSEKEENELVCYPTDAGGALSFRSYIKYNHTEQDGNDLLIYVNFLVGETDGVYSDLKLQNRLGDNDLPVTPDNIFDIYGNKAGLYKLTFKKDSNDNYYWYSSEIVK